MGGIGLMTKEDGYPNRKQQFDYDVPAIGERYKKLYTALVYDCLLYTSRMATMIQIPTLRIGRNGVVEAILTPELITSPKTLPATQTLPSPQAPSSA